MKPSSQRVVVSGDFDDIRSSHLRFLEEAAKLGDLTVFLWSDETLQAVTGAPPKCPMAERRYFLEAVRHVARVIPCGGLVGPDSLPSIEDLQPAVWVDREGRANTVRDNFCRRHGLEYLVLPEKQLEGFPEPSGQPALTGRRRVVVTGCFDWFHSGHVRFFDEVSRHGDLFVIVGHDANIRLLKGAGHPLLSQEERRYVAGSIRHVTQALISSGAGWLDADPEIQRLRPDVYAVNEDGDQGGKREYCREHGIEYLVLKRAPAPGLPARTSTALRGF